MQEVGGATSEGGNHQDRRPVSDGSDLDRAGRSRHGDRRPAIPATSIGLRMLTSL